MKEAKERCIGGELMEVEVGETTEVPIFMERSWIGESLPGMKSSLG